MLKRIGVLFAVLAIAVLWNVFHSTAEGLSYTKSWREACAESRSSGKPILLIFGGPW